MANTIAVTCATSGIGRSVCERLAKSGHELLLFGRDEEKLADLKSHLATLGGGRVKLLHADLDRDDDVQPAAVSRRLDSVPLRGLVLIYPRIAKQPDPLPATADALPVWQRSFFRPLQLLRTLLEHVEPDGRVVIVSGISNTQVFPSLGMSNVIRAAWLAQAKLLAFALGERRIRGEHRLPGRHIDGSISRNPCAQSTAGSVDGLPRTDSARRLWQAGGRRARRGEHARADGRAHDRRQHRLRRRAQPPLLLRVSHRLVIGGYDFGRACVLLVHHGDVAAHITIVPVDRDNWEQCVALAVKPHQQGSVGPNVLSLAEVGVRPEATARAVVKDGQPVGMVVYLQDPRDGLFHVHRFMVDKGHQGEGVGEAALRLVIAEIHSRPDFRGPIMIEFLDNNVDAQRLYERAGFTDTGRRVKNEQWGFVEKVYAL